MLIQRIPFCLATHVWPRMPGIPCVFGFDPGGSAKWNHVLFFLLIKKRNPIRFDYPNFENWDPKTVQASSGAAGTHERNGVCRPGH